MGEMEERATEEEKSKGRCKIMPTYDFLCLNCHKVFSEVLSLAEIAKAKPVCPKCKSKKVKKQITLFITKTSKKW